MPIRGPPIADRLSLISFIDAFSMPTTTPFSAAVPGAQHADFGRPFPTFHTASLAYASIRTHTNTGLCNFTSHSLAAASNPPLNYHGGYFAPDLPPILSHPQHPYRTKCKELPPQVTSEATTAELAALAHNAPCLAHKKGGDRPLSFFIAVYAARTPNKSERYH